MSETLATLGQAIAEALPQAVVSTHVEKGELVLWCERDDVQAVMRHLRDDPACQFKILIDIAGVDYPDRIARFEVVYHLLSVTNNQRIRVKLATDERTPVPSVVGLFPAAGWYEREAWDMYGILFAGNPDLRRILTDYGFDGHPQRKDFPLTGYVEMRYDETQKRVIYEPVKLPQAFRTFDFLSPWEGPGEYKPVPPPPTPAAPAPSSNSASTPAEKKAS